MGGLLKTRSARDLESQEEDNAAEQAHPRKAIVFLTERTRAKFLPPIYGHRQLGLSNAMGTGGTSTLKILQLRSGGWKTPGRPQIPTDVLATTSIGC